MNNLKVCVGKNCREKGSREILKIMDAYMRVHDFTKKGKKLGIVLCNNNCEDGPMVYCENLALGCISLKNAEAVCAAYLTNDVLKNAIKSGVKLVSHSGLKHTRQTHTYS